MSESQKGLSDSISAADADVCCDWFDERDFAEAEELAPKTVKRVHSKADSLDGKPSKPDTPVKAEPEPVHADDVRSQMPWLAKTFRAKTVTLNGLGPISNKGAWNSRSSVPTTFAQINALLGMQQDARNEAWDSLPKQF